MMEFNDLDVVSALDAMDAAQFDTLPFGLVAMDAQGVVLAYNQAESRLSGLPAERVIGRHFFTEVAPCTNNFLVADRFRARQDLDETLNYVFSVKLQPTPVRLRLLRREQGGRMYLMVQREAAHVAA